MKLLASHHVVVQLHALHTLSACRLTLPLVVLLNRHWILLGVVQIGQRLPIVFEEFNLSVGAYPLVFETHNILTLS